jgi:hypothetical protein
MQPTTPEALLDGSPSHSNTEKLSPGYQAALSPRQLCHCQIRAFSPAFDPPAVPNAGLASRSLDAELVGHAFEPAE